MLDAKAHPQKLSFSGGRYSGDSFAAFAALVPKLAENVLGLALVECFSRYQSVVVRVWPEQIPQCHECLGTRHPKNLDQNRRRHSMWVFLVLLVSWQFRSKPDSVQCRIYQLH